MFAEIFSIIAPILICAGIGFFWSKSGRKYDTELITAIVSYFGTPCLIFYSLSTVEISPDILSVMALSALFANLCFVLIGAPLLYVMRLPQRPFLQTLSFPNIGNIGLPVCYLAFGEHGLALGIIFFAVYAAFQLTVGAAFVSGNVSFSSLIRMPIIPATLLAVVILLTDTVIPEWLFNTTKLIGDLTIPLMLFTLGVSLCQLKVAALKIPFLLSIIRIIMGIGVGAGLNQLFSLSGPAAGVVILQCSMPTAVFNYLFAQQYQQRPEDVAGTVIISTLLGFASLPLLLWYVL